MLLLSRPLYLFILDES